MPIDVHAHYVPKRILDVLEAGGSRYGVEVVREEPSCKQCLRFETGMQIRPFFPRSRICRLDAPALCLLLRRYGHAAQLVFGARLEPFGAHCWVQLDDVAVDDADVRVRTYSPLLVV